MGEAFAIAEESRIARTGEQSYSLRQRLWEGIKQIPGIRLNGMSIIVLLVILNLIFCWHRWRFITFSLA